MGHFGKQSNQWNKESIKEMLENAKQWLITAMFYVI